MTLSITVRPEKKKPFWRGLLSKGPVRGLLALIFWLLVWQLAAVTVGEELLLPSPRKVAAALVSLAGDSLFWQAAGASLLRMGAGFAAAVVVGCLSAAATVRFRVAELLLSPLLRTVRAVPVASFIILLLIWVHTDALPAAASFLMVTPVIWGNVEKGLRAVDRQLLEMAQVFRFTRTRTLLRVRVPSVMPYFLSACTTGLGLAWKSGIAAEVIARPLLSIGRQLQNAKVYLETAEMFAWTLVVAALSLLLEKLLVTAVRRVGRRWGAEEAGTGPGGV
ncbi:MAG: ABC transporter permease subunit [Clostridiales bacterium]|nr:ABC transporter permease subunit [Clostridiales bacterium]